MWAFGQSSNGQGSDVLNVERRQLIVAFIEKNGGATVAELKERFRVSDVTVRRDLTQLSKQGYIERGHGGAVPRRFRRSQGLPELPVLERAHLMVAEKRRIGEAAARYVEDGDVVLISGGSTTAEMVPYLSGRRELTVATNALNIASLLTPYQNIRTVITGGVLRHSELSMLGPLAEDALGNLRVDKLFMGSPAIHVDYGLSADDTTEVQSDRNIMAAAREVIVLADHTKFGKIAMMRVAPIVQVRRLITDSGIPGSTLAALREVGIEVEVTAAEPVLDEREDREKSAASTRRGG